MTENLAVAVIDTETHERRRAFRAYVSHALHDGFTIAKAVEMADVLLLEEDTRFGAGAPAANVAAVLETNARLEQALAAAEMRNAELVAECAAFRRELEAERLSRTIESVLPAQPSESDV